MHFLLFITKGGEKLREREREREREKRDERERDERERERERAKNCKVLHQVEIHIPRALIFWAYLTVKGCIAILGGLAMAQNSVTSASPHTAYLLTASCLSEDENFCSYIFFRTTAHSSNAIHVAFPLSFVYLKTQEHILFWIFINEPACQSLYVTVR